jgi:hypothetical protein
MPLAIGHGMRIRTEAYPLLGLDGSHTNRIATCAHVRTSGSPGDEEEAARPLSVRYESAVQAKRSHALGLCG